MPYLNKNELQQHIVIQKHRLDDELEINCEYCRQASALLRQASVRRDQARIDRERAYAEFRERTLREGKTAESAIERMVASDRGYRSAQIQYKEAAAEVEELQRLYDIFVQRSYNLTALAGLYSSDYFTTTRTSTRGTQPPSRGRATEDGDQEKDSRRSEAREGSPGRRSSSEGRSSGRGFARESRDETAGTARRRERLG